MHISEYLDVDKLEQYVNEGLVERRYHGVLSLALYCYTRKATFTNTWDDITTRTRGLIVDATGHVVARPFEKFFNLDTSDRPETHISNLPTDIQPIVLEKLDGSLGTVWTYGSFTGVASKGSFQSEHAKWATAWYKHHCENPIWPENHTPQVEMICQSVQRHVVNYDIPDQLILTALINNDTGEEMPYNELYYYAGLNGMKVADIFSKSVGDVINEDRSNKEGYVLSYPRVGQPPLKLKIKHDNFLKLQKLTHAVTVRTIFESLVEGRTDILQTWVDQMPPELAKLIQGQIGFFIEAYTRVLLAARNLFMQAHNRSQTRAEFAEVVKKNPVSALAFGLLDNKDIRPMAWKHVEKKFKVELGKSLVYADPEDDEDEYTRA